MEISSYWLKNLPPSAKMKSTKTYGEKKIQKIDLEETLRKQSEDFISATRKFASLTKNWFYILISFFFLGLLGKKINIPFPLMFPCHSLKWTSPISYNSYCKLLNEEGRYIFDFGYSLPLHFVMCFETLPTFSNLISKGLYEKTILS